MIDPASRVKRPTEHLIRTRLSARPGPGKKADCRDLRDRYATQRSSAPETFRTQRTIQRIRMKTSSPKYFADA